MLEEELRTRLFDTAAVAALVGTRVYAGKIPPEDSPTPWVFFTVPSELPDDTLRDNTGSVSEVEFELFAETYAEVQELKREVRAALNGWGSEAVRRCLWAGASYTPVEGGHNVTERFRVWVEGTAAEEGMPIGLLLVITTP